MDRLALWYFMEHISLERPSQNRSETYPQMRMINVVFRASLRVEKRAITWFLIGTQISNDIMHLQKNTYIEKCFNDCRRILNADDLVPRVSDSETACKSSTEREIVLPLRLAIYSRAWIIFKQGYSENTTTTRI